MSELTQRQYLAMFMAELDEKSRLRTAREEGIAQMAKTMKERGYPIAEISAISGLSQEAVAAL